MFVGFKEANAPRGVDEKGNNLTSESTASRMTELLLEHGATIEWSYAFIPAVSARIPADQALLSMLRNHANVDYVEPIFGGQWHAAGWPPPAPTRSVLALIRPGDIALQASPGDTITAWHRQPDGTVLRASATISR